MKLTPVQLYTANHHGTDALNEDASVWAAHPEEAAAKFLAGDITAYDRMVHVMRTGLDFTYRIDPDPDPVPSVGWIKGEPPCDGQPYLIRCRYEHGDSFPAVAWWVEARQRFENEDAIYDSELITHHNPTPISLEIP
jgi:hypothetical protein